MAFDDIESSVESGRPEVLYLFALGTTQWRYTSSARDILYGGNLWKSVAISDDGPKQSGDAQSDALTVMAPATIGPVRAFAGGAPGRTVFLTIFLKHHAMSEAVPVYVGEIVQIGNPAPGVAKLISTTLTASMKRDGLRLAWQRSCPHTLYDPFTCRVNRVAHAVAGVANAIEGLELTVNAAGLYANSHFSGGFVEWEHPVRGTEYRGIESHIGTTVLLMGRSEGLFVGAKVKLYPGCQRTSYDCITKFNNYDNYGGIPHLPGRSPFDGNPVF